MIFRFAGNPIEEAHISFVPRKWQVTHPKVDIAVATIGHRRETMATGTVAWIGRRPCVGLLFP